MSSPTVIIGAGLAEALPNQSTPAFDPPQQNPVFADRQFVCGDYRCNGSINGAMLSGRLAAEAVLSSQHPDSGVR